MDIPVGVKRKCRSPSQIKSSKRKYLQKSQVNILNLSDCILLDVLLYLDITSLYNLGKTCTRFQRLVQDKSLWVYVSGRDEPNNIDTLNFCRQNIHEKTKHLLLTGRKIPKGSLVWTKLTSTTLNNLTVVALEHQSIENGSLDLFPPTIQELSFKHSYITHHKSFFNSSAVAMCNLKTLILDCCQWVQNRTLEYICNYPNLEVLSLFMCKTLWEDSGLYFNLSFKKEVFKSLKVVDLRFTGLGTNFIVKLCNSRSIQTVYFQCVSNYTEWQKYTHNVLEVDFSWRIQLKRNKLAINDRATQVFKDLRKIPKASMPKPKSYLYSYSYKACTCGFSNNTYSDIYEIEGSRKEKLPSGDEIDNIQPNQSKYNYKCRYGLTSTSSSELESDDEIHSDIKSISSSDFESEIEFNSEIEFDSDSSNDFMEVNDYTFLKELSFRGYRNVTDKTLEALQDMDLHLLDVTNTKVTQAGTQLFMMYNPQCRLIHATACRCQPE